MSYTTVEIDTLIKGIELAAKKYIPKALVETYSLMVEVAQRDARERTRQQFNLSTDWIPKSIVALPITTAQKNASEKALRTKGDFLAAVYIRGSNNPKNSLAFMADHETGNTRKPQGDHIAEPGKDWMAKEFETRTGRKRKGKTAAALLDRYNKAGSKYNGTTTVTTHYPNRKKRIRGGGLRQKPGNYFIIKGKGGTPVIARRDPSKGMRAGVTEKGTSFSRWRLSFAYGLQKDQRIQATWHYYDTIYAAARHAISLCVFKAQRKHMNKDLRRK